MRMEGVGQGSLAISYTSFVSSLILIGLSYYYYTNVYSYFRRRGVKGPMPYPLVGNLASLLSRNRMKIEQQWTQKYGKFYGVFFGTKPRFVVNDPEVLRQICIKDFDAMPNHETSVLLNDYQKNFLFLLQDNQWKRIRALQSPTFTSGKIKRMFKLLDRCADDLVSCFSEQLDKDDKKLDKTVVNVKDIYSFYTMDAITTAGYTIKLNRKGNTNMKTAATTDEFIRVALELFGLNFKRVFVALAFPTSILNFFGYKVTPANRLSGIADKLRPVIAQRRNSGKKFDDYLQILVNARLDDRIELDEMDEKENHHAGLSESSLQSDQAKIIKDIENSSQDEQSGSNGTNLALSSAVKLTDHEILSSAIFLLIVGLETTSTLLTNCTYALAFHPDIQQRLYETVKSIAEYNEETKEYSFDYDKLTSCEYLDAVISETLRNLSPILTVDRVVGRDYYVEKYGVQLRQGDRLQLAFYAIMNNPEYWPEPAKFDPERFIGDNKKKIVPGSYCPFGLGPRHCLAMRFSLTETKLALAKVLMKFRFMPMPGTGFPPESAGATSLNNLRAPMVELASRVG